MSDRVSETILLCEDDLQVRLVRGYLAKCGLGTSGRSLRIENASRKVKGGNVGWVLREFPTQLQACRQRHKGHAKTLLIVVVDADDYTVAQRHGHLNQKSLMSAADPTVVLIPKRHVETWIRAALGQAVNETESYKSPKPQDPEVRAAAHQIHGWARDNAKPGPTCVDSLRVSLPEWKKIG